VFDFVFKLVRMEESEWMQFDLARKLSFFEQLASLQLYRRTSHKISPGLLSHLK
jgi:hypothetical protein